MNEQQIIKEQVKQLPKIRATVNELEQQFPYSWFVCVDFKVKHDPVMPEIAVKRVHGWLRHLARIHKVHFAPFISVEPLYTGKRMSVHLVLRSDLNLSIQEIRSAWKLGHTWIQKYDSRQAGIEYMFDHHIGQSTHVVCHGKSPCRVNRKKRVFCSIGTHQVLQLQ